MDERVPASLQPLLEEYVSLAKEHIHAFYVVGSIALGEFNEQFSDVDFVAFLNRRAGAQEIEELREVHRCIERTYPRWKMSGSYILPRDLGKLDDEIELHLHYHAGVLHPDRRSELNSITWWELKNHGIAVLGKEPQELPFTVDWDVLIERMRANMNSYWAHWTKRPGHILRLYSNWGIQWAVLGILRQFYTFQENSITTKVRAGQYALGCLPTRWHKLIREAINIRQGREGSAYRFKVSRTIEAVNFLKYIIHFCNTSYPLR